MVRHLGDRPARRDLKQVESIVTEEIARLAKEGPTEEELTRAKTKWEFTFVTGLEGIGGFGGKADILNRYNTYLGSPDKFEADFARYRGATVASVKAVVNEYLNTRNRLLCGSGRSSPAAVENRSGSHQGAAARGRPALHRARGQDLEAANGLEVFVVERPELPKVSVALASRAGGVTNPAGKGGLGSLTARVMRRGTKTKSAIEIDNTLGDLGTSLTSAAGRESARLGLEVLKRNLSPALAVLAEVAQQPSFPAAEFDREKKLALDGLAQAANNPQAVANRVAFMLAFGLNDPYGRPPAGLPSTVGTITRDDVSRFHQTQWKPGSSALVFVGDITLAEATALAKQHFSGWSGGAAPAVTVAAPQPVGPGKIYLIDRQNAAQTVIAHVLPAPARASPDYAAVTLADAVYGGGGLGPGSI